jgi:hypothetical protein
MTEEAVAWTMTRALERVQRPVRNAMNFSPLEPKQAAVGLAHSGETRLARPTNVANLPQ